MRWPWERQPEPEHRQYTPALIDLIMQRAGVGSTSSVQAIGAMEAAAGLWGRAFMAADVLPDSPFTQAVTPAVRELIGRQLCRAGEALFVIEVDGGRVRLDPATAWTIDGGASPANWRYEVTRAGPSRSTVTRNVPYDRVIHLRYAVHPDRPWRGVGPLEHAALTGRLASTLEHRLGQEVDRAPGAIIAVPPGSPREQLQSDLRELDGRVVVLDSTAGGYGAGPGQAPRKDLEMARVGADPPETLQTLRSDVSLAVLSACGVPPELVTLGPSTGRREAFRQFLHATVAPVTLAVAAELADKLLTPSLAFNHDKLFAADLSGRARAFASMTAAGLDVGKAASLAGLLDAE